MQENVIIIVKKFVYVELNKNTQENQWRQKCLEI